MADRADVVPQRCVGAEDGVVTGRVPGLFWWLCVGCLAGRETVEKVAPSCLYCGGEMVFEGRSTREVRENE